MKTVQCIGVALVFIASASVQAGALINGQWQPANCGQKQDSPAINTSDVDAYNQSIKALNAWQTKAQDYYNCVVKEANIDNQVIANTANAAQEEFKREVKRIQQEAETGKAKVERD